MDTAKLKDALADLEHQREMIDQAIAYIRKALALKNGDGSAQTLVDDAADCLGVHGAPLHIDKLTQVVGVHRGSSVTRANLEASLSQHQKTANPKVVRVQPGVYALSSWPGQNTNEQGTDDHGITDDDVPF